MSRELTAAELQQMQAEAVALTSRFGAPLPSANDYTPPKRSPEELAAERAAFLQETADVAANLPRAVAVPQPEVTPEVNQPQPAAADLMRDDIAGLEQFAQAQSAPTAPAETPANTVLAAAARPPAPDVTPSVPEPAAASSSPDPTAPHITPEPLAAVSQSSSAETITPAPAKKGLLARTIGVFTRIPAVARYVESRAERKIQQAERQALKASKNVSWANPGKRIEPTFSNPALTPSALAAQRQTERAQAARPQGLNNPNVSPATTRPTLPTAAPAQSREAQQAAANAEFEKQQAFAKAASARTLSQAPMLNLGQAAAPGLETLISNMAADLTKFGEQLKNTASQPTTRAVTPAPAAAPSTAPQAVQPADPAPAPAQEEPAPDAAETQPEQTPSQEALARSYFQQRDAAALAAGGQRAPDAEISVNQSETLSQDLPASNNIPLSTRVDSGELSVSSLMATAATTWAQEQEKLYQRATLEQWQQTTDDLIALQSESQAVEQPEFNAAYSDHLDELAVAQPQPAAQPAVDPWTMAISRGEKAQAAAAARTAAAQPEIIESASRPVEQPKPGHWDRVMAEMERESNAALADLETKRMPNVADGPDVSTFISQGASGALSLQALAATVPPSAALHELLAATAVPNNVQDFVQPTVVAGAQPEEVVVAAPAASQTLAFSTSGTARSNQIAPRYHGTTLSVAELHEDATLALPGNTITASYNGASYTATQEQTVFSPSQPAADNTFGISTSGTVGASLGARFESRELHTETKLVDDLQAWSAPVVTEVTTPEAQHDKVLLTDATLDAEHQFEEDRNPVDMQLDQSDASLDIDDEYAMTLDQLQSPADGYRIWQVRRLPEHEDELHTSLGMR